MPVLSSSVNRTDSVPGEIIGTIITHGGEDSPDAVEMVPMISPGTESVRLTEDERTGILHAVESVAHRIGFQWHSIAVFGSRADPSRRGGDIDLYIRLSSRAPISLFRIQNLLREEIHHR